ncbi:MAG: bifunctional metallophosphatase/5'-nucleotidase [Armatimonadota bacterium]|nr:MAG: bifunctional metallophosphatase/5'-nucleotidase [Armatimonadota bacterium]
MPRFLKRLSLVVLLAAVAAPAWAGDTFRLTIVHSNDLHGMMEPHEYQREDSPFADEPRELGGLARRAAGLRQLRKAAGNPVVVVEAGDLFTKGPWHERWFGEPEIEALNMMGYDMLCVGNNEFKAIWDDAASKEMMLTLMRRSRFPWLAANVTWGGCPSAEVEEAPPIEGIHPFVVRTFDGVRVGFLGLTAPRAAEYPHLEGWTISDPFEAAKRWVPIARKECDILIAVTHLGANTDKRLAAEVAGIDAIVGGDSHTFLSQPVMAANPAGEKVPIVQAGESGVTLGKMDLTFERRAAGWRLTEAKGELIPIGKSLPEDRAVRALLDRYLAPERREAVPAAEPAPAG